MDPLDNPLTTGPIQTGYEISFELYFNWWPRPPIWGLFGSNMILNPKWQSGTVANTDCVLYQHWSIWATDTDDRMSYYNDQVSVLASYMPTQWSSWTDRLVGSLHQKWSLTGA